jgi:hypothetical protein
MNSPAAPVLNEASSSGAAALRLGETPKLIAPSASFFST